MNKRLALTLIIFVCLLAADRAAGQEIFEESRNMYSTRELEMKAALSSGSMVVIKSATTLRGTLKISTWEEEKVKVVYSKKAKADNRSMAIDYIDLIAVNLVKVPGGVKIELRAPNPAPWSGEDGSGAVEATVMIPGMCKIEADAYYFDIEAEGPFETFVVPASLGRMSVSNVSDELDLTTSNRRVNVENINGEIQITTSNSSLTARNITSRGSTASFRNEGGDIKIFSISGDINVKNSYGRTVIDRFEATGSKSYIRCDNGPVELNLTKVGKGQLIVSNRFEDIEISLPSNVSAEFSLAVEEEGKIEVYNFPFKPDLVTRNRLSLVAGEGEALISGSVRGKGNVYVRGHDPEDL